MPSAGAWRGMRAPTAGSIRVKIQIRFDYEYSIVRPQPLTTTSKCGAKRPYAKRFLRAFEYLRSCDGLMFAKQSCRLGLGVKLGDAAGVGCERMSQKFRHDGFGGTTRRSGACPPRFRWIVAMLSLLPGRDLPGTSGTRVAEARWVVSIGGSRQSTLRASARGTVHFDEQLLLSPL